MKLREQNTPRQIFSTLFLGLAAISLASAQQQQDWIAPAGGSFGLPANWNSAVPATDDLAWFNLEQSSGYTVELDQNHSIGTLQVANDNVILDLGGFNFDVTDPMSDTDGDMTF